MADDVVLRISTDEAKVLEGIRKVIEAQNKAGDAAKRSSAEARAALEAEKAARKKAAEEQNALIKEQRAAEAKALREKIYAEQKAIREKEAMERKAAAEQQARLAASSRLAQQAADAQIRGASRARSEQASLTRETDKSGTSAANLMGAFGKAGIVAAGIAAILGTIKKIDEALVGATEKADAYGKAMLGAAMQQEPGKWSEVRKEVEAIAVAHGQMGDSGAANAAFTAFSTLQATNQGDTKKALDDFRATMEAAETGIAATDITNLVATHRAKGGTGREAVAQLFAAAQASNLEPSQFAPIAAETIGYNTTAEGLAVGVGLSSLGVPAARIPTQVKDTDLALARLEEAKAFRGIKGMSESDALLAVRGILQQQAVSRAARSGGDPSVIYGELTSTRSLQKYTEDEGKAIALQRSLMSADVIEKTQQGLLGVSPTFVSDRLSATMAEDPQIASAIERDRKRSRAMLTATTGTEAQIGRAWTTRTRDMAQRLQDGSDGKFGMPWLVNDQTGDLTGIGKFATAIPMLVEALRENTQATQQNSKTATEETPQSKTQRTPPRNSANN